MPSRLRYMLKDNSLILVMPLEWSTVQNTWVTSISVATVMTDVFQKKKWDYCIKKISQNHETICGQGTHKKASGHILARKNEF